MMTAADMQPFREHDSMFTTLLPLVSEKTPGKTPEKTTQKAAQKATQKGDERILTLLQEQPGLSRTEVSEALGDMTEDGVKYHLARLRQSGRLRRVGPDRGGHWEVFE